MAANRTRVDRGSRTLASLLELKAEAHTAQSKAPPWIRDACLLDSDNLGARVTWAARSAADVIAIGETTDLLFLPLD